MTRHFANSQLSIWLGRLPLEVSLALAFGIVLAALGPYDTYHFPILPRIGFWVGLSAAWFLVTGIIELALQSIPASARLAPGVRLAVTFALAAVLLTALAWAASDALTAGTEIGPPLEIYWQTLLTGSVGSMIARLLLSRAGLLGHPAPPVPDPALPSIEQPATVAPSVSRLEDRLPLHLRGTVLALSSEDHYVRVHTDAGAHMLLMRLSDAIDELDGMPGERVHRSWWVARSAPVRFETRGRTAILRLPGTPDVPVSAPYLDVARTMAAAHMVRA